MEAPEMNKEEYLELKLSIIYFENEDVITDSGDELPGPY